MALDVLPDELIVLTRDQYVARYLRSIQLRDPEASIAQDSQPWLDATGIADQLVVQSQNARLIGRTIPLSDVSGKRLDQRLDEKGLPQRFPEVGSSGFVTVSTSATGTDLLSGDELTDSSQLRFQCIASGHYADGAQVPIAGISTGPTTNLDAGALLTWSAPRPGCFPVATVVEQTDGTGLSGGRLDESDDEVRLRISDAMANPAAAGNDAAYQRAVENSLGHGVSVQKAFTYPACLGPGTIGVAFTLKPANLGSSRIPNAAQTAQVREFVIGQMPADDGYFEVQLTAQSVDIVLDVAWADGAATWVDIVTWPPRYAPAANPGAIGVVSAASPTSFVLDCLDGLRSGVVQPFVGQTIGLLNRATGKFSRKKIGAITGTGPWTITADTTNAASDTAYTPVVNQRVCPWSDSLDLLVDPILTEFGRLGPGEQQATFFDPGLRQKRSPSSPKNWPSVISNRLAGDLLAPGAARGAIQDAVVREGLGTTATIGVPGTTAFLLELGFITAFPL